MSILQHVFDINSIERFIELLIADCLHDTGYYESRRRDDHFLLALSVILGGISSRAANPTEFFKSRFNLIIERMGGMNKITQIETVRGQKTGVESTYKRMREFAVYMPNDGKAKIINDNCDECPGCASSIFQAFDRGASQYLPIATWNIGIKPIRSIWTTTNIDPRTKAEIDRSSSQVYATLNKPDLYSVEYVIKSGDMLLINFGMEVSPIARAVVNNLISNLEEKNKTLLTNIEKYNSIRNNYKAQISAKTTEAKKAANDIAAAKNANAKNEASRRKTRLDIEIAELGESLAGHEAKSAGWFRSNVEESNHLTNVIEKWKNADFSGTKAFTYYSNMPILLDSLRFEREYRQKSTSQTALQHIFAEILSGIPADELKRGIIWSAPEKKDKEHVNLCRNLNFLFQESQFKFWGDFSMICAARADNFAICTRDAMLQSIALFMGVSYCDNINLIKSPPRVEEKHNKVNAAGQFIFADKVSLTEIEPTIPSVEEQIHGTQPARETTIITETQPRSLAPPQPSVQPQQPSVQPPHMPTINIFTPIKPPPRPLLINTGDPIPSNLLLYVPRAFIFADTYRGAYINRGPAFTLVFHN